MRWVRAAASVVRRQDIELRPRRRRRRHGAGGGSAGAAAAVCGRGGAPGPQASVAPVPAVLRRAAAVPGAPEVASPVARAGAARTAQRRL